MSILKETLRRFVEDDGWAIASHVALASLMALFPFLIFSTALAGVIGVGNMAGAVVSFMFEGWPRPVSAPLVHEITTVLTTERRDVLTLGVLATIWVASNAVESLRIALDRAYDVIDRRPWWQGRLLGFAFVIVGSASLLALSFGVVLWPALSHDLVMFVLGIDVGNGATTAFRYAAVALLLGTALTAAHLWLPAGRRRVREVLPGVIVTLALWLIGATLFGFYLARFANYASTYAGLAGAMVALIFMNINASLFILGAEFNAALLFRERAPRPPKAKV